MIEALDDPNLKVRETAYDALIQLKGRAVNRLCGLWGEGRDKRLEELVLEGGYVATSPFRLNLLTLLKHGELDEVTGTGREGVEILLDLIFSWISRSIRNVRRSFRSIY